MKKLKIGLCVLAVVAILASTAAFAATQLLVQPPFRYLGHWVFPDGTGGSTVSIRVKNNSSLAQRVVVEFAGQDATPEPCVPGVPCPSDLVYPTTPINDTLPPYATIEYKRSLPETVTSLNFIRIRRPTI